MDIDMGQMNYDAQQEEIRKQQEEEKIRKLKFQEETEELEQLWNEIKEHLDECIQNKTPFPPGLANLKKALLDYIEASEQSRVRSRKPGRNEN
ncbi:uncharacterized protein KGF55_000470 [Candida pseudojiufengensis]|uniref:uncharacterized protein n=1 Tax=Candida pseudojiufengensis TaxID=497109 RepID=UPI0022251352|nr:uncharacterized protein KGF55_000470 [Candida pseudojiufengensis]KAI5966161.1 hypothetical protein KGF55_000470 [Candida pseudojiufengensis]